MVSARRSALSFSAVLAVDLGACGNQSPACCNGLGPGPAWNLPTGLSGTVERRAFSLCASKQKSRGHRKLTCLLTINTLDFSPIDPHGRLPPLPPLTPCLLDTGRQTPSHPHLPARPMTRPSTRRGTAERGGLREASAAPGRALRDPGGLSRKTVGDPIMPRQKGPERGCVCKDRGPNGPPEPCRPQRQLLRASTPQTVTREAGRRSTRRPRLQLQATVVYRSRPHQNTKPEPPSAPAAGNRGRPPLHRPCANLASSRRARPPGPGAEEGLRLGGSHQASLRASSGPPSPPGGSMAAFIRATLTW